MEIEKETLKLRAKASSLRKDTEKLLNIYKNDEADEGKESKRLLEKIRQGWQDVEYRSKKIIWLVENFVK